LREVLIGLKITPPSNFFFFYYYYYYYFYDYHYYYHYDNCYDYDYYYYLLYCSSYSLGNSNIPPPVLSCSIRGGSDPNSLEREVRKAIPDTKKRKV